MIRLECKGCGAPLEPVAGSRTAKCAYCGSFHLDKFSQQADLPRPYDARQYIMSTNTVMRRDVATTCIVAPFGMKVDRE